MATKDQRLFFKGKQADMVNGNLSGQFTNLNLNQRSYADALKSPKNDDKSQKSISSYGLTGLSDITNKKDSPARQNFSSIGTTKLTSSFANLSKSNEGIKEKESKERKGINANDSTLSLHITAYENSIKTNSDGKGKTNKDGIKNWKTVTKWLQGNDSVNYVFEFPRQQQDQINNPEVMQFRASQQMANVNGQQLQLPDAQNLNLEPVDAIMSPPENNEELSAATKENIYQLQMQRFKVFQSQDIENGNFDVKFSIEGKALYAHKCMLCPLSENLNALLCGQTSAFTQPVDIVGYSFETFMQFLSFAYIGECKLTGTNILEMVDMAALYDFQCLKDFCDQFLSEKEFVPQHIEEIFELCEKYNLPNLQKSITQQCYRNGNAIIDENDFKRFKKPFVQFLSASIHINTKQEFFKAAYEWIEHQIAHRDVTLVNKQEVIKTEFIATFGYPDYKTMDFYFILTYVLERGFMLSFRDLHDLFIHRNSLDGARAFEGVYDLAHKQALKRQSLLANGEAFNIEESIKDDLQTVLPEVTFFDMNHRFLIEFVAQKAIFLTPQILMDIFEYGMYETYEENFIAVYRMAEKQALKRGLTAAANNEAFSVSDSIKADLGLILPTVHFYRISRVQLHQCALAHGIINHDTVNQGYDTRLVVHCGIRHLTCGFIDIYGIQEKLSAIPYWQSFSHGIKHRFSSIKIQKPSTPSLVEVTDDIDWYLCLERDAVLAVKHFDCISQLDYVIAPMNNNELFRFGSGVSFYCYKI